MTNFRTITLHILFLAGVAFAFGVSITAAEAQTCAPFSTAQCRAGSPDGICDPPEFCTGTSVAHACPPDIVLPRGSICNPGSGDLCDPDEVCSGSSGQNCPADTVARPGTLCRPGSPDGICDPSEVCSGTADEACPADVVLPRGSVCNPGSGDLCDPDEVCSGSSGQNCPADTVAPPGTLCRPGSPDGICDPSEVCTGSSNAACPADVVLPAGTVCREGSGDMCDPDEVCSGSSGQNCPADVILPAGTVCREGTGDEICDPDELCTGSSNEACPADYKEPEFTPCGDDSDTECTNPDSCGPGDGVCNFRNQECGSVTSSALCEFDTQPDKGSCSGGDFDGASCSLANGDADCAGGTCEQTDQFNLNFSPDMQNWVSYKQNSTNPGQFFYNVMYEVSAASSNGATLYITVPYPFVTQGGMPLHVYDGDSVGSNGSGCLAPDENDALLEAATIITMDDWIDGTNAGYLSCDTVSDGADVITDDGVCVITVEIDQATIDANSGDGNLLYVNLHLDYGLKGPGVDANDDGNDDRYDRAGYISPWGSSDALFDTDTNDGDVAIADCSVHVFSHDDDVGFQFSDSVENLNQFKKAAGAFGLASCDSDGDPLVGFVQLRLSSSDAEVYTTEIDGDGYYAAAYSHQGKQAAYYLAWCDDAACTTTWDTTENFDLKTKQFVQVDLLDLGSCDGSDADLEVINPIYPK